MNLVILMGFEDSQRDSSIESYFSGYYLGVPAFGSNSSFERRFYLHFCRKARVLVPVKPVPVLRLVPGKSVATVWSSGSVSAPGHSGEDIPHPPRTHYKKAARMVGSKDKKNKKKVAARKVPQKIKKNKKNKKVAARMVRSQDKKRGRDADDKGTRLLKEFAVLMIFGARDNPLLRSLPACSTLLTWSQNPEQPGKGNCVFFIESSYSVLFRWYFKGVLQKPRASRMPDLGCLNSPTVRTP